MDVAGEQQLDVEHNLFKKRLDKDGFPVSSEAERHGNLGGRGQISNPRAGHAQALPSGKWAVTDSVTHEASRIQRNQVAFQGFPAIKSQGGLKCWLFSLCVLRRVLYVAVILRSRIPAYCDLVTEVGG